MTLMGGEGIIHYVHYEGILLRYRIPVLRNLNSCTYDKPTSGCWVRNATHLFHPKGRQLSQPTLELRTL